MNPRFCAVGFGFSVGAEFARLAAQFGILVR